MSATYGKHNPNKAPWGRKSERMSQLKEILEKERERSTMEQCSVIHLFREGTFYRAYEWSAWLFATMANK